MLAAAGPAGAMPFVLALQYQVPVSSVARIIKVSTIISLITVTLVAQIILAPAWDSAAFVAARRRSPPLAAPVVIQRLISGRR